MPRFPLLRIGAAVDFMVHAPCVGVRRLWGCRRLARACDSYAVVITAMFTHGLPETAVGA
jgi:hypothetical protein